MSNLCLGCGTARCLKRVQILGILQCLLYNCYGCSELPFTSIKGKVVRHGSQIVNDVYCFSLLARAGDSFEDKSLEVIAKCVIESWHIFCFISCIIKK